MKKLILTFILFLFSANASKAIVAGESNLEFSEYPAPKCEKPLKYILYNESSREKYNQKLQIYADCVNKYVKNAENDILRIREAQNLIIKEAKKSIKN